MRILDVLGPGENPRGTQKRQNPLRRQDVAPFWSKRTDTRNLGGIRMKGPDHTLGEGAADELVLLAKVAKRRVRTRAKAVFRVVIKGRTPGDVAAELRSKPRSVKKWVALYLKDGIGALQERPRSGRRYALSFEEIDDLIDLVRQLPDRAPERLVAAQTGHSRSTVRRVLHDHGVSSFLENAIHRDIARLATRTESLACAYVGPECWVAGVRQALDPDSRGNRGKNGRRVRDEPADLRDWRDCAELIALSGQGHMSSAPGISLLPHGQSAANEGSPLVFVAYLFPDFDPAAAPDLESARKEYDGYIVDDRGWQEFLHRVLRTLRRRNAECAENFDTAVRDFLEAPRPLPPFLWIGEKSSALW